MRDNRVVEALTRNEKYGLVTVFDALHDMNDPAGACRHISESLKLGGSLMLVEPMAVDNLEDNLNPVDRLYYAFSAMVCTPGSRSQEVGVTLGAQAGEAKLRDVFTNGIPVSIELGEV